MKSLLAVTICLLSLLFAALPGMAAAPVVLTPKELIMTDLTVGKGAVAGAGSTVTIHYTGWLYSPKAPKLRGNKFDSSVSSAPFSFKVGSGTVIRGWDEGVRGMKVGGKRQLIVPAALGFGKDGLGPVPSTANLLFEIELIDVK
ncbi:FKBP-type peptidyl-prolyl cis-trans isomerase [Massilia sp. B-10]|nr:FKBP-type peptidyl-prolyl cis-trans isomerase [Massilia sp. B-10]